MYTRVHSDTATRLYSYGVRDREQPASRLTVLGMKTMRCELRVKHGLTRQVSSDRNRTTRTSFPFRGIGSVWPARDFAMDTPGEKNTNRTLFNLVSDRFQSCRVGRASMIRLVIMELVFVVYGL